MNELAPHCVEAFLKNARNGFGIRSVKKDFRGSFDTPDAGVNAVSVCGPDSGVGNLETGLVGFFRTDLTSPHWSHSQSKRWNRRAIIKSLIWTQPSSSISKPYFAGS